MMGNVVCRYRLLASSLLFVALIVSCASGPTQKEQNNTDLAKSIIAANTAKESIEEKSVETVTPDTDVLGSSSGNVPSSENLAQPNEILSPGDAPIVVEEEFDNRDQFVNGKKLRIPKVTGSVPPRDDEFHDTDNNAIVILQSPTVAMADFPRDRRKEVDWVKSLNDGFIEPRANLKGGDEMVTMDLDIVMKNTQYMPWVKFPHLQHTQWLACENCHPKIFIPQEHANPISMNKVLRGEFCGVCHDKVSFSLFICERCHSVPHEGSGPAWWETKK